MSISCNGDKLLIYYQQLLRPLRFMNVHPFNTPKKVIPIRLEKTKRFTRKPTEKSQKSLSRKSSQNSIKEMYLKSPSSVRKEQAVGPQGNFFEALAESLLPTEKKQENRKRYSNSHHHSPLSGSRSYQIQHSEEKHSLSNSKYVSKISNLQTELDVKNHELAITAGQCERMRALVNQEKEKRRRIEKDRKDLIQELKESERNNENLKVEIKRLNKEKQYLTKQIEFLENISYDEKTRSLQSYRQKYLEEEIVDLRDKVRQSRTEKEGILQAQMSKLKEENYTLESHFKAIKVANECLIKQLSSHEDHLKDLIFSSPEYTKLRDKYIRFLEEYKQLRNDFWALKDEIKDDHNHNSSSLFSITASEIENDLSMLRSQIPPF